MDIRLTWGSSLRWNLRGRRKIGQVSFNYSNVRGILNNFESGGFIRKPCALTDDPKNLNALTPGHFLIGEPLVSIPERDDFRETPKKGSIDGSICRKCSSTSGSVDTMNIWVLLPTDLKGDKETAILKREI